MKIKTFDFERELRRDLKILKLELIKSSKQNSFKSEIFKSDMLKSSNQIWFK